jgi:hypothetical protein
MSEKVYQGSRKGTFITVSKIKLTVSSADDLNQIHCKAEHPAIIKDEIYHHLQASANITVLCKYISIVKILIIMKKSSFY